MFIEMASTAIARHTYYISQMKVSGREKYNWGTQTLCGASANIIWMESHRCIKPVTEHLLLARLLQQSVRSSSSSAETRFAHSDIDIFIGDYKGSHYKCILDRVR